MLQPVSVGLKCAFLIVLYLFLFWVATSALFDLRRGRARRDSAVGAEPLGEATSMYATVDPMAVTEGIEPRLVVDRAAGHRDGVAYDLSAGATLGRGDVEIR